MDGTPARLDLLSFASRARCREFNEALLELGYATRELRPQDWDGSSDARRPFPVVLFLGQSEYPGEKIRSFLSSLEATAKVAVVEREELCWDSAILSECTDFLAWPCPSEELRLRLARAQITAPHATSEADAELREEFGRLNLYGRSPAFLRVLKLVKKFGRLDVPVLVQGATGTGKELVARAIHYLGLRKGQPFIPVNCGAIPDNLVENELFGHERGAFTDAKRSQQGLVAQADGGTLFLDEVDTLSPKAQVALLRFLEQHEFRPLGGGTSRKIDVRIIAAANTDLGELAERREFRQDLFFRLNILLLFLPPLSRREEDVVLLARHFVRKNSRRYRQPEKALHPGALEWMRSYDWPGNVRELENLIHRAVVVSEGPSILAQDLLLGREGEEVVGRDGSPQPFELSFQQAKSQVVERFERRYLNWLMAEAGGNVTLAASRAGKERRALGRLLKKHGIHKSQYLPKGSARPTRPGRA